MGINGRKKGNNAETGRLKVLVELVKRERVSLTVSLLPSLVCVPHYNSHTTLARYNFLSYYHIHQQAQSAFLFKKKALALTFHFFWCPISVHFHPVKRANLVSSSFLSILLCCLYYIPWPNQLAKKHYRRCVVFDSIPYYYHHHHQRPIIMILANH